MSWHFSQALEAAYSGADSSDGAPSAPSNSTPTPDECSSPGRTTEASSRSQSGTTCEPSTADRGEALLTSFLEAFRAKTSPSQGRAQASTESAPDSGRTWPGLLARYDPASRSWKTPQLLLGGDLAAFSVTWPRSGTMRNGACYQRPPLVPLTDESGCGLRVPTPTAQSGGDRPLCGDTGTTLSGFVMRWPTPTVSGNYNRAGCSVRSGDGLATAVARRWSTPTAHNAKETNAPLESNLNTPTLAAQAGGPLNPTWVEWLMGWPLGWTDCGASATGKSRSAPRKRSDSLPQGLEEDQPSRFRPLTAAQAARRR